MASRRQRLHLARRTAAFGWWCRVCAASIVKGAPLLLLWTAEWGEGIHPSCFPRWSARAPQGPPEAIPDCSLAFLPALALEPVLPSA